MAAASSHDEEQVSESIVEEEAGQEEEEDQQQVEEEEYVSVEVTTEVEETVVVQNQSLVQQAGSYLTVTNAGRAISFVGAGLLVATLVIAVQRVYERANTATAKRMKLVDRNKKLVSELGKYLPNNHAKLNSEVIKGLKSSTGFTPVEIFRKYLWFLLRERKFDQAAVDDMVALKVAAGLSDTDVATALAERAQRIYDKYGTLMLNTEGFSTSGLERKATVKALSQKVLFLVECEALVTPGSDAASKVDLRTIFGATEEDMVKLRMASLHAPDVDLERIFQLTSKVEDDDHDHESENGSSSSSGDSVSSRSKL